MLGLDDVHGGAHDGLIERLELGLAAKDHVGGILDLQSGKGRALRPTPPLRTRRASFPAPDSSLDKAPQSTRRRNLQSPSRYGVVPS
jgi:hypothetical protein